MLIKKLVSTETVTGFTCDRCGKAVSNENDDKTVTNKSMDFNEGHFIKFTGGYTSVFGDCAIVECDLCQICLHYLIKDFCRISFSKGIQCFT